MLRWFANLKVAHKLAIGFGLVLLLLIGTLVTDVYVSDQQSAVGDHIIHHLIPAFGAAHEIVTLTRAADDDGAWYLLARDKKVAAASLNRFEQYVQQLRAVVAEAAALADTPVQRKEIQEFSTFYFRTGGFYDDTLGAFKQKQEGQLQAAYDNYVDSLLVPSLDAANGYANAVERDIAQETAAEDTASRLVLLLSLSLGGLATLLGIGIAILIARSISRPLKQVEHAVALLSLPSW